MKLNNDDFALVIFPSLLCCTAEKIGTRGDEILISVAGHIYSITSAPTHITIDGVDCIAFISKQDALTHLALIQSRINTCKSLIAPFND